MLFTSFLKRLKVTPEPGQHVLLRVMCDGVDPIDLEPWEQEIAREMFGGIDRIPQGAREVLSLVAGGRGGKTYFLSLYTLYLALTVNISHLAPGERAFSAIVCPSLELSQQNLRYIAGAMHSDPDLRKVIVADNTDELVLYRQKENANVAVKAFAAARGGVSGRGKSLISVLMSETCFFRDKDSGVVNDETIFKAASPRVVPGGKTVLESTPWVSSGLLFDIYNRNFGKPKDSLVAQASTRMMRTNAHILSIVDREEERDPDNAAIEFGAQWGAVGATDFFLPSDMERLFVETEGTYSPRPGDTLAAAVDLGFVKNSASMALLSRPQDMPAWVSYLEERRPHPGAALVPSEVCGAFAGTLAGYGSKSAVADGHYKETLREYTNKLGIGIVDSCGPAERFTALRTLIRQGGLFMNKKHPLAQRLRRQLLGVKARKQPGGGVSVTLQKDLDGSHGDVADVLARAAWAMLTHQVTKLPLKERPMAPLESEFMRSLERKEHGGSWWNE